MAQPRKDKTKLVPKKIRDKRGRPLTVWVKPGDDANQKDRKKRPKGKESGGGKRAFAKRVQEAKKKIAAHKDPKKLIAHESKRAKAAVDSVRGKMPKEKHAKLVEAKAKADAVAAKHKPDGEGGVASDAAALAVAFYLVVQDAVNAWGEPSKLTTGGSDDQPIKDVIPEDKKKKKKPREKQDTSKGEDVSFWL